MSMHFHRDFYAEAKREYQKMMQSQEEEFAAMTEEDRREAIEQIEAFLQSLAEHSYEQDRLHIRVSSRKKCLTFDKLAEQSLKFAENNGLIIDITCKENDLGTICFKSDFLVVFDSAADESRLILLRLLQAADQIIFKADGGMLQLIFLFSLYDEVEV